MALQDLTPVFGGLGNWIVRTRHGRLDVMQWVDPFDSYDELRVDAVEQELDEIGRRSSSPVSRT